MQRFLLLEEVTLANGLLAFLAFLGGPSAPLICTNLAQNELKVSPQYHFVKWKNIIRMKLFKQFQQIC